ncbi:MAG: hypothetical protein A2945_00215 [Candidatus Liptonbacteria bacterium RIFCSPLOWO2_01_FULL_52_25]|uniref:EfeO-type cupredoxin-like domain-containing protein n=1 Tax=Candidatus Liptonbacteria bacterium RIFCSPLOWO2_01_FULL_52_25 TaxID=1798650 RepID=A0A1G2CFF7_9BACT|nr:MAG: hypothetical protein A2945_00215 [Candidatus Liptonbacteria bacterium RIFCSPLOWO2_01_FULL_52_25]
MQSKISIPGGFYLTLAVIAVFFIMTWLVMFQRVVADFATLTPAPLHRADFSATADMMSVTYDDRGFSPSSITVEQGTTVIFKNMSSEAFWPASASHPAHDGYPKEGGCSGSTFDACEGVPAGKSWSFRFDIPGTWGYHNHLNPRHWGTVVVE